MIKNVIIGMLALGFIATSCSDDDDSSGPNSVEAGVITGGPFSFIVDDEIDNVTGVAISEPGTGTTSTFVITNDAGVILGLPPTIEALGGVDFNAAGTGTCFIWYLSYSGEISGATVDMNADDLEGNFALSNSIEVTRIAQVTAGTITGGPFEFDVDGDEDFAEGIEVTDEGSGESNTFVITDAEGNILGLPPTLEALGEVNFDAAGPGVCLIWYLSYDGELDGANMGDNANDLGGNFALSDPIEVTRNEVNHAGVLSGGPYEFTVDGEADFATDLQYDDSAFFGSNSTFVITAEDGTILGLPPTLEAARMVDFDAAGAGTCFIWHLSFEDDITGAEMGMNAGDLGGTFDLSNSIEVVRN